MTSFTRIVIVFVLCAGARYPQSPPNQVMIALALFLTIFIMEPVWSKVHKEALQPYMAGEITQTVALDKALLPIRSFMFEHTRQKDLALFVKISKANRPTKRSEVSTFQLLPAFVLSELKTAFHMGFMIYVPFLVMDMWSPPFDGHGYDDVAAGIDIATIQNHAFCLG